MQSFVCDLKVGAPYTSMLKTAILHSVTSTTCDRQINTSGDSAVASTTDSILASQQSEVSLTTPYNQ